MRRERPSAKTENMRTIVCWLLENGVVFLAGAMIIAVPLSLAALCQWAEANIGSDSLGWLYSWLGKKSIIRYTCHCNKVAMWFIFAASIGVSLYLGIEKTRLGELPRMRHAIGILFLIGLAIASASIYGWDWLNGDDDSNSATVRNIALGFAAALTLIFVIWRERIASGKATSDRFESAVQMLGDPSVATCIAGIRIIRDLGQYPRYRRMGLAVLNAFVDDPAPSRLGGTVRSRGAAVQAGLCTFGWCRRGRR